MQKWAKEKGFDGYLPAHLEKFLSSVKASGRRYVDWDEAFINCVRDDWGDVRRKALVATGKPGGGIPWWSTDAGILAKGKELGMSTRAGESWPEFKGRINAEIEKRRLVVPA